MLDWFNHTLSGVNPIYCYVIVGLVIALESMGVPLPGETALILGLLMHLSHPKFNAYIIAASAAAGAIIGDNIGFFVGSKWGTSLLAYLGNKFPKHFGPHHVEKVEGFFEKYGVWTVFFGRFIALLRILCGPIAGMLKVPYHKFFIANTAGGLCWVGLISILVVKLGEHAEKIIARGSWGALAVIALIGAAWFAMRKFQKRYED